MRRGMRSDRESERGRHVYWELERCERNWMINACKCAFMGRVSEFNIRDIGMVGGNTHGEHQDAMASMHTCT
jgi:hypothetical protein